MNTSIQYLDESTHVGDNNFYQLSSLETAIEQIKKTFSKSDQVVAIVDELADYLSDDTERQVIGLESKLNIGGRLDLLGRATRLKNRFAMRVAKDQMSITEQRVYVQILSAIITAWHQIIFPRICDGADKVEVDKLIQEEVISPVHQAIVRFDCTVTTELVAGMLYFLTGKCHVKWRGEC